MQKAGHQDVTKEIMHHYIAIETGQATTIMFLEYPVIQLTSTVATSSGCTIQENANN
jgi:hypothetical protein